MNFVCDKCKQKYHVADEKIRGRAVTRFRCKKCENVIELRSDALPDPDAPGAPRQVDSPSDRPRPATMAPSTSTSRTSLAPIAPSTPPAPAPAPARTAARTRAPTSVGVAFNAGMAASAAKATPRTASTSAILNASETGWYAGIRDLPVGPLTRKELIAKVQSAEVTPDTLVWREGLDDWRPLRNVAELGDVLRLGAQRMSGNLLDDMGRRSPAAPVVHAPPERRTGQVVPLRQPAAATAPAITRPAMTDDDEEATRVTGLDPAIAALIPRSLSASKPGPVKAAAPVVAEDESADQTLIEPPVSPGRGVEGTFAKPAAKAPAPHAPPPKAPPPKAPIRAPLSTLVAKAAPPPPARPAVSTPTPVPEPMPSLTVDSVASSPPSRSIEPSSQRVSSMPPAAAVAALAGDDELPEDLFGRKPFPPQSNAPSLESFGLSAAFSSGAQPASMPAPLLQPAMMTAPAAPPQSVRAPATRPAGLSMPVVILMAGVLVVGVFGGVLLAGRINRPPPQAAPAPGPIARPEPTPPPAPIAEPVVAVAEPTPPAPEVVPPAAAPEVLPDETPGHPRAPRRPAGGHEVTPGISAAQAAANARALQQQLGGPSGPSGSPVNTVRAPVQDNSAGANTPAVTGAARANRAIRAFQDSRVVNQCWQNLLRMNPSLRDASVRITLSVSGTGRFSSAAVSGSPDPRFDTCIRGRLPTIPTIGAGESFDAQTTVNLTTGG